MNCGFWVWSHRWKVIGAEIYSTSLRSPFYSEAIPQENETTILYRCTECGKHKNGTLKGSWTVQQLNA